MADPAVVEPVETPAAEAAPSVAETAATQAAVTTAPTETAATTEAAAPVVPETYDLKWPDGSTVDPAIVERTAATARALGLTNEAGQKLLDQTVQELTERETQHAALVESWKPGGAEFVKRDDAWRKQALADPDLGGGDPAKFATTIEKAQQALTKYGPELKTYLDETGLGSHPAAIKFLANIGKAMSEGSLVLAGRTDAGLSDAERLSRMYPSMAAQGTT